MSNTSEEELADARAGDAHAATPSGRVWNHSKRPTPILYKPLFEPDSELKSESIGSQTIYLRQHSWSNANYAEYFWLFESKIAISVELFKRVYSSSLLHCEFIFSSESRQAVPNCTTCLQQSKLDWCVCQRKGNRPWGGLVLRKVQHIFIFGMTDRKPILDFFVESCDPPDGEKGNVNDTNPAEDKKCGVGATEESNRMRKIPPIQALEEALHSAPRSCRHCDEVWPRLYLGDMWASYVHFDLMYYVWVKRYACMTRMSGSCLTTSSGCGSWESPMSWMLRTGNSAVRGMRTFMGPQWNTTESLPMTCPPSTFHHSFTLLLSSFTTLCPQAVNSHPGSLRLDIYMIHLCIHYLSLMIFRKGVCALRCGCESLSCLGPGLPDDPSSSHSPVLCALHTTEALDFSQQRLFETTYNPGPAPPRIKRVKSNC